MSLIQSALERAEQPDPDRQEECAFPKVQEINGTVCLNAVDLVKPAGHHEPRLNSIRYYEAANQTVEESIQEQKKEEAFLPAPQKTAADPENEGPVNKFPGIVFALLALSFAASWFVFPSLKSVPEEAAPAALVLSPASSEKPEPVIVKTQKLPSAKPSSQIKFLLTGITSADNTLLALINNQVVGVGDRLREGAIVRSITSNRVVLEVNGRQVVLNF